MTHARILSIVGAVLLSAGTLHAQASFSMPNVRESIPIILATKPAPFTNTPTMACSPSTN